jgi:hypothetical protein
MAAASKTNPDLANTPRNGKTPRGQKATSKMKEAMARIDDPAAVDAFMESWGLSHLGETPQDRLMEVAGGRRSLEKRDVEALLTRHVLDLDEHVTCLGAHCKELLDYLLSPLKKTPGDPEQTLRLIERLNNMREVESRELRKTADLLVRLSAPRSPRVNIIAVKNEAAVVKERSSFRQ